VNFDQVKFLLVVQVVVVDVFQFQFQILNLNQINFQDYQNDIEFENVVVVVVEVVDFVRVKLYDKMRNVWEYLLETNNHS